MTINVFISYSHKDEDHKKSLEEHLSILRRSNMIRDWNDRKIIAGQEWKEEISIHLESSDLILFLISPSFLASDYCLKIEATRAMELHASGKARLIPIIVRPCDWNDCEFSRFQAAPKDANPITKWQNTDEAWLDVINGIKAQINDLKKTEFPTSKSEPTTIDLSHSHAEWIDDTEIALTHRKVNKVRLYDIYISPDIKIKDDKRKDELVIESSDAILTKPGNFLISGEDQQGKTTLLKQMFTPFLKKEIAPIYVDAKEVTKSDLEKIIQRAISEQYQNLTYDQFASLEHKVLLIDNLDEIGLNKKFREIFIESANKKFSRVIATCHSSFSYISADEPSLSNYNQAELLGFGNAKREEIIKKWITIGVEESIDDIDLYSECDDLKAQLNQVIKKNIVPAKPIYILMLLQMFEAYAKQNIELTSHGHCYQQLIYTSFENARIKGNEYEKYLNVLTELSWEIFKNEGGLNHKRVDDFFDGYEKIYLSINRQEVLRKLIENSILDDSGLAINFKYPYIYYFFAAKKIAETYTESIEIQNHVQKILENLHREDFANILIFITHHTKDSWVLSSIKDVLSSLYMENKIATLDKSQLSFMDDFVKQIPELVLEQREVHEERDNHNKILDDLERSESPESLEEADILTNINKTFKGMEIAGQIIRNRHATLTRDALYDLANTGTSSGLRFLDYFISISDSAKNEIIKFIENQLSENPRLSDNEIQKHAKNAYLHITYGIINGVVRKIASSIGSKEAAEIYNALELKEESPAFTLINQSIELQFRRYLDVKSVEKTLEKIKGNAVCCRILKEMVVQHIYMFPVEYKTKQQLSSLLGLSVKGQQQLDQRKKGKE